MMDCKYIADKVWLYVEGDLQRSKEEIVAQHTASCRECAELVEEAVNSQQWLKSLEPERFDAAALDSIRRGARQKIAELGGGRSKSLGVFDRLNWKMLIIACPILLMMFLFAIRWIVETRHKHSGPRSVAQDDGNMLREDENRGDARGDNSLGGKVEDPVGRTHKRRVVKRIRTAPSGYGPGQGNLMARGETYPIPPLRIEIQTQDPNVRIIWFALPGDAPVPSGPDKNEDEQERLCFR